MAGKGKPLKGVGTVGILFADLKILQKIKMIKIMKCFGV